MFGSKQCSILAKKVTCTCACNFKNIMYAHNLVYMHMMWMMKYMHKIYVVLQGMVIPDDIPASISSLRRALLMSHVMPHHLHCKIKTQYFHHAEVEQIHLYFYLHLFLLSPSPCLYLFDTHLKCYCFIIVLCTLTNIVKQVIENLHAHVHVGWKILLAPRKKYICICASVHV